MPRSAAARLAAASAVQRICTRPIEMTSLPMTGYYIARDATAFHLACARCARGRAASGTFGRAVDAHLPAALRAHRRDSLGVRAAARRRRSRALQAALFVATHRRLDGAAGSRGGV